MNETLRRTSLGRLQRGGAVNLELALRAEDRLGGHFVQGHVDGAGTVAEMRPRRVRAACSDRGRAGAWSAISSTRDRSPSTASRSPSQRSLTDRFTVSLIPETLERTNLGATARVDA